MKNDILYNQDLNRIEPSEMHDVVAIHVATCQTNVRFESPTNAYRKSA